MSLPSEVVDNLLVVFSNYNGKRTKNDLDKPRISMSIESFRNQVPHSHDLHVLKV